MAHEIKHVTLHADLETPVSAYLKLSNNEEVAFLFESVEGGRNWARYSIVGIGCKHLHKLGASEVDSLAWLRHSYEQTPKPKLQPEWPSFVGGAFGFVSYDAAYSFEPIGTRKASTVPDVYFVEPELLAVFDRRLHCLRLFSEDEGRIKEAKEALRRPIPSITSDHQTEEANYQLVSECPASEYEDAVLKLKEHIYAGDIIQAVLSRRFVMPRLKSPFEVYRGLRVRNPSPYMFHFRSKELELSGASPEVMMRVVDDEILLRPIAGTRPRGNDKQHDLALEKSLHADPKERAEHVMLVDLGRNDLGRISLPGSVSIDSLMHTERYSHVMHIVSELTGKRRSGIDAFDALRATFPAGTLSGAPKVRAMQLINQYEHTARGVYGGAVGYFAPNGNADFGIAIRTLVSDAKQTILQAGAGIVADSDPHKERLETEHKAQGVIDALKWSTQWRQAWSL